MLLFPGDIVTMSYRKDRFVFESEKHIENTLLQLHFRLV